MKLIGFILALCLSVDGWSQVINPSTERYLSAFLATTGSNEGKASFFHYLGQLESRKARMASERDFVEYSFNATHKRYLKHFAKEASFATIFDDGRYNCLTGTILYSLILSHFNISHQVIETNYHILF
ncbi:hypothetical protein QQ054_16830 [Oscillatoria amoena NRMC-F 0135]|nr:hypothetical protein [Oscillatoria amoena NRMC-F 0135]